MVLAEDHHNIQPLLQAAFGPRLKYEPKTMQDATRILPRVVHISVVHCISFVSTASKTALTLPSREHISRLLQALNLRI